VIRTIGDPVVRFREDPVRILRAAKFAGRLGFSVEPATLQAMAETSTDLVRSAPPRLLEEILRLLRSGHSLDSFQLLRDVGAIKSLVPVLAEFLAGASHAERVDFWRLLEALDHRVQDGHVPCNGVLLGALLVGPVLAKAERNPGKSPSSIAEDLLGPLSATLRLPKRDAGCLKRICGVQHRFLQSDDQKRFRTEGFLHGPYFLEALELFELRTLANGGDLAVVDRWYDLTREAFPDGVPRNQDVAIDDEPAAAPVIDDTAVEDASLEEDAPVATDTDTDDGDGAASADEAPLPEAGPGDAIADHGQPEHGQPDDGEPGREGPGRRRRRRRRRRRSGRDRGEGSGSDTNQSGPSMSDDGAPAGETDAGDIDAPASLRTPKVQHDFVNPEGAEDDSDVDVEAGGRDADEPMAPAEIAERDAKASDWPLLASDPASGPGGDDSDDDRGRRRRRRRRRRRGGRSDIGPDGQPLPRSEEPSPHSEAVDGEPSPPPSGDAPDQVPDSGEGAFAHGELADGAGPGDDAAHGAPSDVDAAPAGQPGFQGDERGSRRRRRRRGRGRGGHGEGPHGGPARDPRQQQQHQQQQRQRQHQQQHGQRHDHDRRDRNRGHQGHPRDVDVVPRYRDRRGKVDVIEPTTLDLSAFDVELDPKRVPTFGSIVEGKGRPKKRSPRVPEDGVDDYKPPPPPGSDLGPSAPPPPPADDTPDSFGDW
jgi:hypothetical protein